MFKNKPFFVIVLLLICSNSFSQLRYTSNGNIVNKNDEKLRVSEVKELLAENTALLDEYTVGRSKKTAGNIMLIGGLTILAADLSIGYWGNKIRKYPNTLTIVGGLATIISIPVKIGFSKRIQKVVVDYNKSKDLSYNLEVEKIVLVANEAGIGVKLTLK